MQQNKIVHKGCIKCMSTEGCKCLPIDGYTNIDIMKTGVFKSKKSLKVRTKKQTLNNGVEIPSGLDIWIDGANISDIRGTMKILVPNKTINGIIKMVNLEKLKRG